MNSCYISLGVDKRPHIFELSEGSAFPLYSHSGRKATEWDGKGLIEVQIEAFRGFLRRVDVGDSFDLCGHHLLAIDREPASWSLLCMTDTPAAHRAFMFRLQHRVELSIFYAVIDHLYPLPRRVIEYR